MKASQRYFPLLLLLHKVSAKSNVKSVDEILKCDHISAWTVSGELSNCNDRFKYLQGAYTYDE